MFMIYRRTKFHLPSSSGSLIIAVKIKPKDNFRTAAMLLLTIIYYHA
jgi:hypothetical protein